MDQSGDWLLSRSTSNCGGRKKEKENGVDCAQQIGEQRGMWKVFASAGRQRPVTGRRFARGMHIKQRLAVVHLSRAFVSSFAAKQFVSGRFLVQTFHQFQFELMGKSPVDWTLIGRVMNLCERNVCHGRQPVPLRLIAGNQPLDKSSDMQIRPHDRCSCSGVSFQRPGSGKVPSHRSHGRKVIRPGRRRSFSHPSAIGRGAATFRTGRSTRRNMQMSRGRHPSRWPNIPPRPQLAAIFH